MPRSTQQDPPSPHPRKVPTSGFPFLRWVLSAVPPKVSGLCLVLPSTLSVAVLPPGQVWGRGRSGPSMPFHGGSIMHPLTSILSHRPGGLTGGDSAPETSVVPRTWKSGIEEVVWLHTLQYPGHPTEGDPPYQQYRVGEPQYGWMDVDCLQRFGTLQDECHACPPVVGEGQEPEPIGRTSLSCVHSLACRKAEAPAENSDIPTSWAHTNGPVHGPCLFWMFPINGITPCMPFCVCFSH